jgi:Putative translation initiation inhibitor, yjgF family
MKPSSTLNVPEAVGSYSQAIAIDSLFFAYGQLLTDPATGTFPFNGPVDQARQCFKSIVAIAHAGGTE